MGSESRFATPLPIKKSARLLKKRQASSGICPTRICHRALHSLCNSPTTNLPWHWCKKNIPQSLTTRCSRTLRPHPGANHGNLKLYQVVFRPCPSDDRPSTRREPVLENRRVPSCWRKSKPFLGCLATRIDCGIGALENRTVPWGRKSRFV